MAAADPSSGMDAVSETLEPSRQQSAEYFDPEDEDRMDGAQVSFSARDKERKIGHRRVDKSGIVSYKKKPTSELMSAIQLGIGQSVGRLSSKPERDVLMQDFGMVEVVFFPGEGSNMTPAHHHSDFRFKTYAPDAFRYFRELFGIQPADFLVSLCDEPMKELSNPGASGSIFYISHDDEFIIKTVQHKEADFLQKLLPGYYLNISQNKRTLLPKFYGLYCYQCGGKNIRFTVMNNLLPSTVKLHEKYDMKGSSYKRKASKKERAKSCPTLKDLDFMDLHQEGLQLEKDTCDALMKTLQRDCRVLESFKIMDYSLLIGIYNLDQASKDKNSTGTSNYDVANSTESNPTDSNTGGHGNALHRAKSIRTRIGQYSTPLESIQGTTDLHDDLEEDEDVPPGGIPARNSKGERLLMYLGIIDILQSYRLKKKLEHTVKSMVIDGDTISVHRPNYYASRFLHYHGTKVFKKYPTALKHSPSKKRTATKSMSRGQTLTSDQEPSGQQLPNRPERSGRTISFSDESGAVGGKPDLLPEYSKVVHRSPSPQVAQIDKNINQNGSSRTQMRSDTYKMTTYPSEDTLSAGTASTVSLRGVGVSYQPARGTSPPLSLSESTPTHTDFTEGTPSFTNSSPSCSSDVMAATSSSNYQSVVVSQSPLTKPSPTTTTDTSQSSNNYKSVPTTTTVAGTAATLAGADDRGGNMGSHNPLDSVESPPSRSPDFRRHGGHNGRNSSSYTRNSQQTSSTSTTTYFYVASAPTSPRSPGLVVSDVQVTPESPPPPLSTQETVSLPTLPQASSPSHSNSVAATAHSVEALDDISAAQSSELTDDSTLVASGSSSVSPTSGNNAAGDAPMALETETTHL